ncbi:MAG: hypothetical protein CM15mP85_00870 [Rhodobacterales bacterium]|nr:MAG: hypothetical protein CM15mP85_00870 [Rhodobacterales bacterium]
MSKMKTAADRDRRQLVGATRGRDLYWGFTIGVFANLVTLYLIISRRRFTTAGYDCSHCGYFCLCDDKFI